MISDDADNLAKAKAGGLTAFSGESIGSPLRPRSPAADICAPDLPTVRTYVEGLRETSAALLDLIAASGLGSGEIEEGAAEDSGKGKKKLLYEDVSSPLIFV